MRKGAVIVVIAVAASCLLPSCKDKKMENAFAPESEVKEDSVEEAYAGDTLHLFEDEEPPAAVDELFDDFFYNFIDDSRFQSQRISYPLPCRENEEEQQLTGQEWPQFDHFNGQDLLTVIYEREQDFILAKDTSMQHVGVEWIQLGDKLMEKYQFNRVEGKWMLTAIDKMSLDEAPHSDFLLFYAHFITDSTFQRSTLADPIKVVLTSDDGEEAPEEEFINADEWFAMRENLPLPEQTLMNVDYGQARISQNRKILLLQGISNGMQIKFKFNHSNDGWKLTEIEY